MDKLNNLWMQKEGSIAHDFYNFFAALSMCTSMLEQILPSLLKGYSLAVENQLMEPDISKMHLRILQNDFVNTFFKKEIEKRTALLNVHIDSNQEINLISKTNETLSAVDCIEKVLQKYPFSDEKQRELVQFDNNLDYRFKCSQIFIEALLENFLDNALLSIKQAGKGSIKIWIDEKENFNTIEFKDTGMGFEQSKIEHIFKGFVSPREQGPVPGFGLCYLAICCAGGDIKYESIPGEYTHFTVLFPKITTAETLTNP